MIKYAIRHKATGLFMPRGEHDRGYSHWRPGTPENSTDPDYMKHQPKDGMYGAIPDSIRLLETERQAKACITQWARGMVERCGYGSGPDWEERLTYTNDGRKSSDLEVVRMALSELPSDEETAAMEKAAFGDLDKGTGIYAPRHDYPACAIFRGGRCTCDEASNGQKGT